MFPFLNKNHIKFELLLNLLTMINCKFPSCFHTECLSMEIVDWRMDMTINTVKELLCRTAKKHFNLSFQYKLLARTSEDTTITWLLDYLGRQENVAGSNIEDILTRLPETIQKQSLAKLPEWVDRDIEFTIENTEILTVNNVIELSLSFFAQLTEGLRVCSDQINSDSLKRQFKELIDADIEIQYQIAHSLILELEQ